MTARIRDLSIILWVVMQGYSWLMPDAYGKFEAQAEVAYYEAMDSMGVWKE